MNKLGNCRERFFDLDHGHVTEADKVENYRFLKNWSMDFDENQAASILFQLRISKARKSKFEKFDFLKILLICTCKVEKIGMFFTPDLEVFYNWR